MPQRSWGVSLRDEERRRPRPSVAGRVAGSLTVAGTSRGGSVVTRRGSPERSRWQWAVDHAAGSEATRPAVPTAVNLGDVAVACPIIESPPRCGMSLISSAPAGASAMIDSLLSLPVLLASTQPNGEDHPPSRRSKRRNQCFPASPSTASGGGAVSARHRRRAAERLSRANETGGGGAVNVRSRRCPDRLAEARFRWHTFPGRTRLASLEAG